MRATASYVYELVLALQHMGWRWIETYIWTKPNAIPGRFGPRTKDSFKYVYAFDPSEPWAEQIVTVASVAMSARRFHVAAGQPCTHEHVQIELPPLTPPLSPAPLASTAAR